MVARIIGAILVVSSCFGLGISVGCKMLKEIRVLDQWIKILNRMQVELRYSLRSLPDLFRFLSHEEKGELAELFLRIAIEMENQIRPDVARCIDAVLMSAGGIPESVIESIGLLGVELGKYDLDGQLLGINNIRERVIEKRNLLNQDKAKRIRGYQTLGVCTGAALVILFI